MFGSGSRAGVAVLLLVKWPGHVTGSAAIHYYDIGDYLSREQKLEVVGNAQFNEVEWTGVTPNEQGDWINQRSADYLALRPVAAIQSEDAIPSLKPLFTGSSYGVKTNRDSWVYNSSGEKLRDLVERQVAFYNEQVKALKGGADAVARAPSQFQWDGTAEQRARRGLWTEVRPGGGSMRPSTVPSSASASIWIGCSTTQSIRFRRSSPHRTFATRPLLSSVDSVLQGELRLSSR